MVKKITLFCLFVLMASACAKPAGTITAVPTTTSVPPIVTATITMEPTLTASPAPTPVPSLWVAPYLPEAVRDLVNAHAELPQAASQAEAQYILWASPDRPISTWIYALAAPFYTVADGVSSSQLQTIWQTDTIPANLPVTSLLVSESTSGMIRAAWGVPGSLVRVLPADQMLETAWQEKTAWAIIPFEEIQSRWKVLTLDGMTPLSKDFDPAGYPLSISISLMGPDMASAEVMRTAVSTWFPISNRDPQKLTTVILTGVTALVRGTAAIMELEGNIYPASDEVAELLRSADITHISNEIPFAEDCPNPAFEKNDLVFCSRPKYIELLEYVGADVIELTGDHFFDWGPESMLYTLSLYNERGWGYYGGGRNIEDASRPLKLEVNGNKIAFIGCNGKAPGYATASPTVPGAYHCSIEDMVSTVKSLRAEGYLPIFTFQHQEYYLYEARPALQQDFQAVADAGAVIVSGSQAHMPHAFEFRNGAFIHYGLGNLFFDQFAFDNTNAAADQAFIDRHVFYDGRYIGTELVTIRFVDMARSRLMLPGERADLLRNVFSVSR